jgi:hypothetical protein
MAEERVQRRLAAILAADVVGYSRLMGADEAGTLATLKARRQEVLEPLVAKHQGRIVKVMGSRHRAAEFRKFLDMIEASVSKTLDVHLVMDNYATHKAPLIRNWLVRRPRWHVHLTPTSASWLNQVERFFAALTDKKIRRGVHRSVAQLTADIAAFIAAHNAEPKPFAGPSPPTTSSLPSSGSASTMPQLPEMTNF